MQRKTLLRHIARLHMKSVPRKKDDEMSSGGKNKRNENCECRKLKNANFVLFLHHPEKRWRRGGSENWELHVVKLCCAIFFLYRISPAPQPKRKIRFKNLFNKQPIHKRQSLLQLRGEQKNRQSRVHFMFEKTVRQLADIEITEHCLGCRSSTWNASKSVRNWILTDYARQ